MRSFFCNEKAPFFVEKTRTDLLGEAWSWYTSEQVLGIEHTLIYSRMSKGIFLS